MDGTALTAETQVWGSAELFIWESQHVRGHQPRPGMARRAAQQPNGPARPGTTGTGSPVADFQDLGKAIFLDAKNRRKTAELEAFRVVLGRKLALPRFRWELRGN